MKKKSIYLSIMLIISSLLFVSSCQRDAVPEDNILKATVSYETLELRSPTPADDWCDNGGSFYPDPFFYISKIKCESDADENCKCDITIQSIPPNPNLQDMRLATTEFNFITGTGTSGNNATYYPLLVPSTDPNIIGQYRCLGVIMQGTHFLVESDMGQICNTFENGECY